MRQSQTEEGQPVRARTFIDLSNFFRNATSPGPAGLRERPGRLPLRDDGGNGVAERRDAGAGTRGRTAYDAVARIGRSIHRLLQTCGQAQYRREDRLVGPSRTAEEGPHVASDGPAQRAGMTICTHPAARPRALRQRLVAFAFNAVKCYLGFARSLAGPLDRALAHPSAGSSAGPRTRDPSTRPHVCSQIVGPPIQILRRSSPFAGPPNLLSEARKCRPCAPPSRRLLAGVDVVCWCGRPR